ncbi:hypothetical protein B0T19DRAFT_231844 [Cercophora scortea]|uniref:Uncharacterized protein n=1 Tax=Cercophora scortea TaxID=314031 RepID=A0AAE0IGD4_9PEZI|nr:hypothetical protein B0T19DRAFT_231844 [Cercophora scortea]
MSMISASQIAHRTRYARAAALGALRSPPSVAAPVIRHSDQQQRAFRFARLWAWSSYLDPEFQRDLDRRHRHLRHKYTDSLNRRLSWEKHPLADDAKSALKRMSNGYWRHSCKDSRPGGRYVNLDSGSKSPDNPEGIRPGRNIEDVERAPLEDLLFGRSSLDFFDKELSPFSSKKYRRRTRLTPDESSPVSAEALQSTETDYIIDPITNRKVPKSTTTAPRPTSQVDEPAKHPITSFKSYRSMFAPPVARDVKDTRAPIFYDGPPPAAELKRYSQVDIYDVPWDTPAPSSGLKDAWSSDDTPISWHHGDGIAPASMAGGYSWGLETHKGKEYTDLHLYKPLMDESPEPSTEDPAPKYKDLDKYGAVKYQEPDGKISQAESGQEYTDLHKYDAAPAKEQPTQEYTDLSRYGPVKHQEPDGSPAMDQPTQKYSDLDSYGPAKSHEPNGKYQGSVETAVDPEELSKYQAFRSHEPDGKYAPIFAAPALDPAELAQYATPFRSHEPDGKYASDNQSTSDGVDLAGYQAFRSHEPDGKYAAGTCKADADSDVKNYGAFRSHEPDGKYAESNGNSSSQSQSSELGQYQAVLSDEPNGKYAVQEETSIEAPDLGNHEAFSYEDSESKIAPPTNLGVEDDLFEYSPACHNEPDGKETPEVEQNSCDPAELSQYKVVRWNEPDGKPAEQQAAEVTVLEHDLEGESPAEAQLETKSHYRELLESLMPQPEQHKSLSGNYVRDFPEEFAASWARKDSDPNSPLLPKVSGTSSAINGDIGKQPENLESKADSAEPLQPALERFNKPGPPLIDELGSQAQLDPFTHEPKGLETSYAEECGDNVPPFVKVYGATKDDSNAAESASSATLPNPPSPPTLTIYKILVFNPTKQAVEIAETTSTVLDNAAPLTPADVLLRISNPHQFLPHFPLLQEQGFEIVSGSGDVLIFRKVHETGPSHNTTSETSTAEAIPNPTPVNPIDMTGSVRNLTVAAGRFASPTGFVNFDLPPPNVAPIDPPPRFVSGIDVRREEPVFSGPKAESKNERTKSLPKRIAVGAVWLAGVSYSLGVVGEYFKSGGSDGNGPRSL